MQLPAVIARLECLHCFRPEREAEQLAIRQKVRQAIMAGRVTDAQQLLHECNPDMLESVTHPNLDVLIFFHCLHYIELIRWVPQCIAKRQHIHRACAAISVTRSSCYVAPYFSTATRKAVPACPIKSCMAKIRHVSVTSLANNISLALLHCFGGTSLTVVHSGTSTPLTAYSRLCD